MDSHVISQKQTAKWIQLGKQHPLQRLLRSNIGSYTEVHERTFLTIKIRMYMKDTLQPTEG